MKKGLILQERDVELLEFLAEYKTMDCQPFFRQFL